MIEYNAALGTYSPAFFKITIDSDLKLNDILNGSHLPTFVHEYIHFLQDVSTSYGLANMTVTMNVIHSIYKTIHSSQVNKINIPITITSKIDTLEINQKLYQIYSGSNGKNNYLNISDNSKIINYNYKRNEISLNSKHTIDEYSIECEIESNSKTFQYKIGGIAILEAMARIGQRIVFPGISFKTMLPYNSLDLLNSYFKTKYSDYELFCIADLSLLLFNPQYVINEFFNNPIYMTNGESITQYYNRLFVIIEQYTQNQVWPKFNETTSNATKSIDGIINSSVSKDASIWANGLIEHATSLRRKNPSFIAEIICSKDAYINLVYLMEKIGSPLVLNNKDESYLWFNKSFKAKSNKNLCTLWLAIQEIYRKFFRINNAGIKCNLQSFCSALTDNDYVNDDCNISPWNKSNVDPLCNFGHIWRIWGFEKIKLLE